MFDILHYIWNRDPLDSSPCFELDNPPDVRCPTLTGKAQFDTAIYRFGPGVLKLSASKVKIHLRKHTKIQAFLQEPLNFGCS